MDSPLLALIRERTTMGVQMIKEKTGTAQTEIDPEYQTAVEHFEILSERLKKFFSDVDEILKIIPSICASGNSFADHLTQANVQTVGKIYNLASYFDLFFSSVDHLASENFIAGANAKVLTLLKETQKYLTELETLKDERRRAQLLYDHSCENMLKIEKKGNVEKTAEQTAKVLNEKNKLDELTKSFNARMETLWKRRFQILEEPLDQFIGVIYGFCFEAFKNLRNMQKGATPEELMQQFMPQEKTV